MTKTRVIAFGELRRFLMDLAFEEKRTPSALVFQHPEEGLLVFRLYRADEPVDTGDLVSTRKFLDFRGLLDAKEFDGFLRQATTRA